MRLVMAQRAAMMITRPPLFSAATLVAVMLAIAAAASACGGGGASIDERNAKASPAVAYESGAGFLKALERAGVPCAMQEVTPFAPGTIYDFDTVTCTYSEDDWVRVQVYASNDISRAGFEIYFKSGSELAAGVGSGSLTLKGELWLADGTSDQRLFDIQEALGGQLCYPEDCLILAGEGG